MLYRDYEEKLENEQEEYLMCEEIGVIPCEDDIIIAYYPVIEFPELGLACAEGVYCNKDDEEGYMADFALTLVYDIGFTDINDYLYWEQDPVPVSLHNFLYATRNLGLDEIDSMTVILKFENDIQ